jgi:hypothetical protein
LVKGIKRRKNLEWRRFVAAMAGREKKIEEYGGLLAELPGTA